MADPVVANNDAPSQAPQTQPADLGAEVFPAHPVQGIMMQPKMDPSADIGEEVFPAQQQQAFGAQGSGTPSDPYKGFLEFTQKLNEATQVGTYGFRESALGHAVANGQMSLEEAEQKIDSDEHAKWTSNDVEQYEKNAWKNWATGIPVSLGIETAKALPFLGVSTAAYGVGSVAGGAIGAPTGPGALATSTIGGIGTAAGFGADYIFGQDYLRRRRQGASDGEAKLWAGVSGLAQGALQAFQIKSLASVPINAAKVPLELAKPTIAKALAGFGNYVVDGAKFVTQQVLLGEAQKAVDLTVRALEGTIHGHAGMVPTVGDAINEFGETLRQTAFSSALLHGAGTVAGKTLGSMFTRTVQEAHDTHIEDQVAKLRARTEPPQLAPVEETHQSAQAPLQGRVEENVQQEFQPLTDEQRAAFHAEVKQLPRPVLDAIAKDKAFSDEEKAIAAAESQRRNPPAPPEEKEQPASEEKPKLTKTQEARLAKRDEHKSAVKERITAEQALDRAEKKLAKARMEATATEGPNKNDKVRELEVQKEVARQHLKFTKEVEGGLEKEVGKIDKQEYKEAQKRLKGIVSKIESPKQNGLPNSRMARGTDIQQVLNRVREFVGDPGTMNAVKLKYEAAEAKGDVPLELQRDMDIAKFVGNVENATTAELNKLADRIEATYKEGRAGRLQEIADAAEARHQLVQSVIEGLQGNTQKGYELQGRIEKLEEAGEPVPQELRDQLEAEKTKTAVDSGPNPPAFPKMHIPHFAANLINIFGNWPSMLRTMFRNAANRDELVEKLSVGPILVGIDNAHRSNIKTLYGHLTRETGLTEPEVTELLRKGAKQQITVRINGKPSTFTINQALDKLAQWEDPEAREALMQGNGFVPENGFTPSTADEIETAVHLVNPAYPKIPQAYKKAYKELYPRLGKEYREKTGEKLPDNPDYSGPMIHLKVSKEITARDFEGMLDQASKNGRNGIATPGSTKARSGDTSALAFQDIHAKFKNYSAQTENWIGWRKPMQDVFGPVTRSTEISTIIKNKFGPDALRSFHDSFQDIVFGNADKKTDLDRFLEKYVFSNVPFSVLAAKPFMLFKHIASTGNGARYIPVADYVKYMVEFYSDPFKNYKEISQTPEFQARHAGHEIQTLSALQAPEKMEHPASVAMQHFFMAPTIYGIKSEAAQYYAIRKYWMSEGLSEEAAMRRADAAVNESQVSGRADMRAAFARGGAIGKLAFAFQSQLNSQAQDVIVSWDRFRALPTKENFKDAVKASTGAAVTTAIFESFNAAYNYVLAKDDKERADAALDFVLRPIEQAIPFVGLPGVREVARNTAAGAGNIVAASQGEEAPFRVFESEDMRVTFTKGIKHTMDDVQQYVKKGDDWLAENFFKVLYDLNTVVSPFVKTPAGPILHSADKAQKKMNSDE